MVLTLIGSVVLGSPWPIKSLLNTPPNIARRITIILNLVEKNKSFTLMDSTVFDNILLHKLYIAFQFKINKMVTVQLVL